VTLRAVEPDEPRLAQLKGSEVLDRVGELIGELLPRVPFDDPFWGALKSLERGAQRRCQVTP
jgi:hypothetical protein